MCPYDFEKILSEQSDGCYIATFDNNGDIVLKKSFEVVIGNKKIMIPYEKNESGIGSYLKGISIFVNKEEWIH